MNRLSISLALLSGSFSLVACDSADPLDSLPQESAAIDRAPHTASDFETAVVATHANGLRGPRDIAFNPTVPGELWIVNQKDDSVVIVADASSASPQARKLIDPYALHFMDAPTSISFADNGFFGTCQESRNTYNDQAPANDFMGPTLWTSDPDIFAKSNPIAIRALGSDLGSHMDMLHESPNCMGIAWEKGNVYWTMDGLSGSISRYDFQRDHGPGFDDHSDGIVQRFTEVRVARKAGVPSHVAFDHETGYVFVADTGHGRVILVDTSAATEDRQLNAHESGVQLSRMKGAQVYLIADSNQGLQSPSGLTVKDGLVYVGDNATGIISSFDIYGTKVDTIETGLPAGSLMGIRVDDTGAIFAVDGVGERVLRFTPKG